MLAIHEWSRSRFIAYLVDHVAFWVPALVAHIAVDLHELLEDRGVAPDAFRREACAVVEVAVHVSGVLVVRVLRTE